MFTKRERFILLAWLLSWLLVPVAAQVRPGLFSTLVTTDTTVNSLVVGGSAGGTVGTGGIKAGPFTGSVNNIATTAMSTRFNASNPLIGFGIANSNGFPYLGFNTISQTGSDTPKYDINGFAMQQRTDNGVFKWLTAPSGTAGNAITFTERWGINAAGDYTFGASSRIADSSGTPTIASGFAGGSIAGNDYAFVVTEGGGAATNTGDVTVGHTFSNPPVCSAISSTSGMILNSNTSTTTISITGNSNFGVGVKIMVLCRGY